MKLFISYSFKTKDNDTGFGQSVFDNRKPPKDYDEVEDICKKLKTFDVELKEVILINWKEI